MPPLRSLVLLAFCLATTQLTTAAPPQTPALLTAAQKAMATTAGALKTLRLTGTEWASQGVFGGYTQDTEAPMEIRFGLPDRFLMITLDQIGTDVRERRLGFMGPRTINERGGKPVEAAGSDVYGRKKAAELLLGILGRYETWAGLSFEPDGPDALRVRGPANYSARLAFDPVTHLPATLTYRERRQVRTPNTIRRKGTATDPARNSAGSGGGRAGSSADLPEIDIVITFRDHRNVGGFRLPHRITWTAKGIDLWEYRFAEIVANPPLTDKDFGG